VARRLRRDRPVPRGGALRSDDPVPPSEAQRRIEEARARLKASIPPPSDEDES